MPSLAITQRSSGSSHSGASADPVHCCTQVPSPFSSTSQHMRPMSQSSSPLTPLPSTVQASPICLASSAIGEQRNEFHAGPPSFAYGMHFSPSGQSCAHGSHSPPPIGSSQMNVQPVSLSSPSLVDSSPVSLELAGVVVASPLSATTSGSAPVSLPCSASIGSPVPSPLTAQAVTTERPAKNTQYAEQRRDRRER